MTGEKKGRAKTLTGDREQERVKKMTGEKKGRAKEEVKNQKSTFIYFLTVTCHLFPVT
ncbi:hypothetical protein [Anabaena azotica]|uniref:hypothetical protein n=1 Tax=Anabaena azotica TaxID=197653 RepID=UPI0039A49D77